MGMLAIIPVLLSFNAIYVLIPILIIIILIAAAAGLTRGTDIFNLLGFGAIMGFTSGMGQGRAKGLRGRKYGAGGAKGAARIKQRAAKQKKKGAAAKVNKKSGGSVVKGATKFGALGGALAMRGKVREQMLGRVRNPGSIRSPNSVTGAGKGKGGSGGGGGVKNVRFATKFTRIRAVAGRVNQRRAAAAGKRITSFGGRISAHENIAKDLRSKTGKFGQSKYERPGRLGYAKGMLYIGRKGKRIWIPGAATAGAVIGGAIGVASAVRYRGAVRLSKDDLHKNFPTLYDKNGVKLRPASKNERREIKAMKHDKIKEIYTRRQENQELKRYRLTVGRRQYRQEKREILYGEAGNGGNKGGANAPAGLKERLRKESEDKFMHGKEYDKTGKVVSQGAGQRAADNLAGGFSNRKHLNRYSKMSEEDKHAEAERKVKRMKQIGDKYGVTAATAYAATMFTMPTLRNAWRQRNAWKADNSPHSTLAKPGASVGGPAKSGTGGSGSGATSTGAGGNNNASGTSSERAASLNRHLNGLNRQKEGLKNVVESKTERIKEGGAGAVWASFSLGFTGDKIRSVNNHIRKTNGAISKEKERQEREGRLNEQNKKVEDEKNAEEVRKKENEQHEKIEKNLLKESKVKEKKANAEKANLEREWQKQHNEELKRQADWDAKRLEEIKVEDAKKKTEQAKIDELARQQREADEARRREFEQKELKKEEEKKKKKEEGDKDNSDSSNGNGNS